MVTHNPDLAEKYSSRIIKILDGKITDDSNPYNKEEEEKEDRTTKANSKVSMSFFTALSLSLNNLMTKKGRTILTSFAGSIGIIDAISYVLIAFVAISLVVSSIMIGIITYISVLERTKEIGILRSIGASKKDISRVFNAETFIVGLGAGILGIVVTLILNIPINMIIKAVTDIGGLASLPVAGGVILVIISMLLTVIAGLIPAKMASKKDPVEALRTE